MKLFQKEKNKKETKQIYNSFLFLVVLNKYSDESALLLCSIELVALLVACENYRIGVCLLYLRSTNDLLVLNPGQWT